MVSYNDAIDAGLRALADTTRREILVLLQQGQLSVLEIAERFPMSRPAISKHLKILKEAGLVLETPNGRQRLYALDAAPLEAVRTWLGAFSGADRLAELQSGREPGWHRPRRAKGIEPDWRVW